MGNAKAKLTVRVKTANQTHVLPPVKAQFKPYVVSYLVLSKLAGRHTPKHMVRYSYETL